ncbi:MAG: type IV toxin-antitoxin system AbiEi family antitoxin domain-containing protein [Burkholderiales bacterium]|nr:type IV toxin-antitoxin system AbiEi family antitoxin domain-containing protein [Burkholderiales bacterium]
MGVSGATLQQLLRSGELVRIGRGLYVSPHKTLTEHDQLAQLATKYPLIVFCLLTALKTHGLTTQNPHEV